MTERALPRKTTLDLSEAQWQALAASAEQYDRSRSYLIRKAVELVFVLKLIDIAALPQEEAERAAA